MTAARIPAAEWQAAKGRQTTAERDKLAAWLRVDASHPQAWFAMLPFARLDTDDGPRCAAVMPPNLPLAPGGPVGVHDDAAVVLIAPTGTAALHRDPGAHLVGTLQDGPMFTNALTFARAWARERLLFCERLRIARETYHMDIHEDATGAAPGTLLIGDASRVQWPRGVDFQAHDEPTAKVINIAIWKAAQLSRATVAQTLKAVG